MNAPGPAFWMMGYMDQLSLLPQVTASQLPDTSEAILDHPASANLLVDCRGMIKPSQAWSR